MSDEWYYMNSDLSHWTTTAQQDLQDALFSQSPELSGQDDNAYLVEQSPTPMLHHQHSESAGHTVSSGSDGGSLLHPSHEQHEYPDPVYEVITVSTYFHPTKFLPLESDMVLRSSDGVRFYVHTETFNAASDSAVSALLRSSAPGTNDGVVSLPETGQVLNILLHAVYGTSCAENQPSCDDLIEAIDKLPKYGFSPKRLIHNDSHLYNLLFLHAPLRPLDIYALAGHHDIEELAKHSSSHLLGMQLGQISDAVATHMSMGTIYLKRLFLLHMNRMKSLKRVISQVPLHHPFTRDCNIEKQKSVTRAWALGATQLAWELRADISTSLIRNAFEPLAAELECPDCKETMNKHIQDALDAWAAVKCTI